MIYFNATPLPVVAAQIQWLLELDRADARKLMALCRRGLVTLNCDPFDGAGGVNRIAPDEEKPRPS